MDRFEVYNYVDSSTKLLKKDINRLYIELQTIREQKALLMDKIFFIVFACFLMVSAATFISGLLYMFWEWVLS